MLIYRAHRGGFDAWKRYSIHVDSEAHKLSDGQVISVPGDTHAVSVFAGGYAVHDVRLNAQPGYVVVCRMSANPKLERPEVRLSVISEGELQQQLFRFDRPPYAGGRVAGMLVGVTATVAAWLLAVGSLLMCIRGIFRFISEGEFSGALFLVSVGTLGWSVLGYVALSGSRGLFYYFKLPPDWRH